MVKPDSSIANLHPIMRDPTKRLVEMLYNGHQKADTLTLFLLFEGYRSPERQQTLYDTTKSTKARAWQSAHQYGLAADFVPYVLNEWSWANHHDWKFLKRCAQLCGLDVPIDWDKPHVQHPAWDQLRSRLRS